MLANDTRKAAILIRSLDPETAARLLSRLTVHEADAVRSALRNLGEIEAREQMDVLSELRRGAATAQEGGVELALSASATAVEPDRTRTAAPSPLADVDKERVVLLLAREQPQTIAAVLAQLSDDTAAFVLGRLPGETRCEVIDRLASLREADPETLRLVERQLAQLAVPPPEISARSSESVARLVSILRSASAAVRTEALQQLRLHNKSLADELSRRLRETDKDADKIDRVPDFVDRCESADRNSGSQSDHRLLAPSDHRHAGPTCKPGAHLPAVGNRSPETAPSKVRFEQLSYLDSTALAEVLSHVEPRILVLALAGADAPLVDRIAGNLNWRARRRLRHRLSTLGPVRLRDLEFARQTVADVAAKYLQP
jgi:flagellar motor switch protein FliG